MRNSTLKRESFSTMAVAIVAVAICAAAAVALSVRAYATTTLEYEPTDSINPVSDNITRLNVNKLEKGSRDYVEGAHMVIIEKETGKVVTEWVTDGKTHEVARNTDDPNRGALNIDTVYILRELEAPEGYAKAADTEFMIHSDNFNTTGEIISGDDADSEEIRGSGPEQAYVINLYDEAVVETTEERTVPRRTNNETGSDTRVSNQENRQTTRPTTNDVTDNETLTRVANEVTKTEDNQTVPDNQTTTVLNQQTGDTLHTVGNQYVDDTQYVSSATVPNGDSPAPNRGGGTLTQTGDETTYLSVVFAGLAGMAILHRGWRRRV